METKARLLIVDDEALQLRALVETLNIAGFNATGFTSAPAALAAIRPAAFDLLLTDLMMPEIDGIALIKAAGKIDPSLGAVVMTGHGTIDTAVLALQGGALDYVLKPFRLNVIVNTVSRALAVQCLRRENLALLERERRHAQELAAAYRDLEAFSYSVSHDLRAPLRAVGGYSQILEEDFAQHLDAECKGIVQKIRAGTRRMDELIVGLLEFSRVGRIALQSQPVDMTALAMAATDELKASLLRPEPHIEISTLPPAAADPTLIRQVWSNLIGNAVKYSAKREQPIIKVSGRVEEGEALYEVEDNGAGFDMRFAANLFGVFQRLHRFDEFPGTGVGLAIAQRIVTRHGGRIWAQGTPDVGACFRFALPQMAAGPSANRQ